MIKQQSLNPVRAQTADGLIQEEQLLLRIGAICAISGPLVLLASFVPHGDLPTNEASLVGEAAALRFIADHSTWLVVHLGTIIAGLLWIGAFSALAGTLTPGVARALGRLLVPSAIVGGVFQIFDYGVDGYALKIIADSWAATSGAEQAQLLQMADTALWFLNGTFRSEILIFYGLTVLLAGLAVAYDGRYPVWFGWIATVAGALVAINALFSYAGLSLLPRLDLQVFVVILPIESLWLIVLGVMMWRRAGQARETLSAVSA